MFWWDPLNPSSGLESVRVLNIFTLQLFICSLCFAHVFVHCITLGKILTDKDRCRELITVEYPINCSHCSNSTFWTSKKKETSQKKRLISRLITCKDSINKTHFIPICNFNTVRPSDKQRRIVSNMRSWITQHAHTSKFTSFLPKASYVTASPDAAKWLSTGMRRALLRPWVVSGSNRLMPQFTSHEWEFDDLHCINEVFLITVPVIFRTWVPIHCYTKKLMSGIISFSSSHELSKNHIDV